MVVLRRVLRSEGGEAGSWEAVLRGRCCEAGGSDQRGGAGVVCMVW